MSEPGSHRTDAEFRAYRASLPRLSQWELLAFTVGLAVGLMPRSGVSTRDHFLGAFVIGLVLAGTVYMSRSRRARRTAERAAEAAEAAPPERRVAGAALARTLTAVATAKSATSATLPPKSEPPDEPPAVSAVREDGLPSEAPRAPAPPTAEPALNPAGPAAAKSLDDFDPGAAARARDG